MLALKKKKTGKAESNNSEPAEPGVNMRVGLDNFLLKTSEGLYVSLCVYTHEQYFIISAVCLGTMSPLACL